MIPDRTDLGPLPPLDNPALSGDQALPLIKKHAKPQRDEQPKINSNN